MSGCDCRPCPNCNSGAPTVCAKCEHCASCGDHTPGCAGCSAGSDPERIFRVHRVGRNYHVCEGREAAPGVAAWVGGQDSPRAREAAYLFAAAPDLLAAVEGLLRLLTTDRRNSTLSAAEKAQIVKSLESGARAAVAKARKGRR